LRSTDGHEIDQWFDVLLRHAKLKGRKPKRPKRRPAPKPQQKDPMTGTGTARNIRATRQPCQPKNQKLKTGAKRRAYLKKTNKSDANPGNKYPTTEALKTVPTANIPTSAMPTSEPEHVSEVTVESAKFKEAMEIMKRRMDFEVHFVWCVCTLWLQIGNSLTLPWHIDNQDAVRVGN
jgi:hypothetical protein